MGMAQSAHGVDHMNSNECLLADPVSHTDDEEAGILGRVLYKAEFGDLENNHVNYDTILWILISLPLIMAWGIGVLMLLFLPMRRYIIRKDIRSRMLCVTSHAIVYKVARPMFLPFLGVTRAEKHVPLSLITDIVIEQGCLQAKYGLHTIRVENLANGNSKPVDEFQIQGVVNPKHFMKVILREASKFRMDVSLGREQRAHNLCLPSQAIPISELSKEIASKHPSSIHGVSYSFGESGSIDSGEMLFHKLDEVERSVKRIEAMLFHKLDEVERSLKRIEATLGSSCK